LAVDAGRDGPGGIAVSVSFPHDTVGLVVGCYRASWSAWAPQE